MLIMFILKKKDYIIEIIKTSNKQKIYNNLVEV
jgi:hypothetical protein